MIELEPNIIIDVDNMEVIIQNVFIEPKFGNNKVTVKIKHSGKTPYPPLLTLKNIDGVITGYDYGEDFRCINQPDKIQSRKDKMQELYESIINRQYVTFDGEPTDNCPMCQSLALLVEDQPEPGTHAYSIVYRCGSRVDAAYNSDEYHFYQSDTCKGV